MKLSDFNETRNLAAKMNPRCNFDKSYTFIYDETNNIRKFYLNDKSFNYSFDTNFVLGGVVYEDEPADIEELFRSLNMQDNITEVKFKHIATGDFLSVLKSNKLTKIFEYILSRNIFIHFYSVNFLYFSLVDVIDSIIEGANRRDLFQYSHELKSILYDICKNDINSTVDLFNYANYPNVSPDYFGKFSYHLKKLLNKRRREQAYAKPISMINELLDGAVRNKNMPFITDEESKVLIKNFFGFYLQPLYMFNKSMHLIDNEESIKEIFDKLNLINDVNTHSFVDSSTNRLIQLSDIIVGFIGKLSLFVNTNNFETINAHMDGLNINQRKTLKCYFEIIKKSLDENPGFINQTISITDHKLIEAIELKISV